MNDLQELTQKWQEQVTFHANTAKKCTDDVADLHAGFAAAYENAIRDLQVIIRKKKYASRPGLAKLLRRLPPGQCVTIHGSGMSMLQFASGKLPDVHFGDIESLKEYLLTLQESDT